MRIKSNKPSAGNAAGEVKSIIFTGPLYLHGDPIHIKDAATKRYVDSKFSALHANDLQAGTIKSNVVPRFQGDVSNQQSSTVFSLNSVGMTPGSYNKVRVDFKGRVVEGSALFNEDIPNLTWQKVVRDRPNTMAGYGITDIVGNAGGAVGEGFKIQGQPTELLHLVNRRYVMDMLSSGGSNARPGSIFPYATDIGVDGFLRCNGAYVSKALYPNLYDAIGDKYKYDGEPAYGSPWQQQYNITKVNDHILGVATNDLALPVAVHNPAIAVTRNRVYVLGGNLANGTLVNTVYIGKLNAEGRVESWTTGNPLPYPGTRGRAMAFGGRLYLHSPIEAGATLPRVYVTNIEQDGSIGPWNSSASSNVFNQQLANIGNYIYSFGGVRSSANNSAAENFVTRSILNSSGIPGTFNTVTPPLPIKLAASQLFCVKNRIYLVGGFTDNQTSNTATNKILTAAIQPDSSLTDWTTSVPLNTTGSPSTAKMGSKTFTFPGGTDDSNIETVRHREVINPSVETDIDLVIPPGGFVTIESEKKLNISGSVSTYNNGTLTVPENVKRVEFTARGSNGTAYKPAVPEHFVYLQYSVLREAGRYTSEDMPERLAWRSALEAYFVTKRLPDYTEGNVDPYPTTASVLSYYRSQMYAHSDTQIYDFFNSSNLQALRNLLKARYEDPNDGFSAGPEVYNNLYGVITRREKLSAPNENGKTEVMAVYYLTATFQWQPYQAPIPATQGPASVVTYNGTEYVFPGSDGEGSAPLKTIEIPIVGNERNFLTFRPAGTGSLIQYKYQQLTGETQEQTYLTDTQVKLRDIDEFTIFGKGSNWLRDLPTPISGHTGYVSRNKGYIFSGMNSNKVYSVSIDDCRVLGKWQTEADLPVTMQEPSLVATSNRLLMFNKGSVTGFSVNGGLNDYSRYYYGLPAMVVPTGFFVLPDFSHINKDNTYYYIKY